MEFADIILIGDSRASGLKAHLRNMEDLRMDVNAYPGANIKSLRDTAKYLARENYYKYIYIFGGVNDITMKEHWSGKVVMNYECVDDIHTTLMGKYIDCYKTIKKANSDTKVVFLPLIGLDMAVYNGRPRCKRGTGLYLTDWKKEIVDHPLQQRVNEGVLATNETLLTLNAIQKLSTPLIHHSIHKRNRANSPYRHLYFKLEDGLHPFEETAHSWSLAIEKVVRKNLANE